MINSSEIVFPEPIAKSPEDDPLTQIEQDHLWQEKVALWIQDKVEHRGEEVSARMARLISSFLTKHLRRHTLDEEKGLFPLLRAKAGEAPEVRNILDQLSHEHDLDGDLVNFMLEDLDRIAKGQGLPNSLRLHSNLSGFATTLIRHLSWENRVLIPMARELLEPAQLSLLREFMRENAASFEGS